MNKLHLSSRKSAFFAVILAILLTTGSTYLVNVPHNVFDEYHVDPINWDFSSSLGLSSQIQDSPLLLGITIDTYHVVNISTSECITVIKTPVTKEESSSSCIGYETVPAFYYYNYTGTGISITEFEVWYISEDKELNYLLDTTKGQHVMYVNTPINDELRQIVVDPMLLSPMTQAFAQDIRVFNDFITITQEEIVTIAENLEIGDNYWRISLIFADGTLMEFYYYGPTIIVRSIQLDTYISIPPNGAMYGPIDGSKVYPTYTTSIVDENPMSNFIRAAMDFVDVVMNG